LLRCVSGCVTVRRRAAVVRTYSGQRPARRSGAPHRLLFT